jgi:hypothetical protein
MGLVDAHHFVKLNFLHHLRGSVGMVSMDAHHFGLSLFEQDVE